MDRLGDRGGHARRQAVGSFREGLTPMHNLLYLGEVHVERRVYPRQELSPPDEVGSVHHTYGRHLDSGFCVPCLRFQRSARSVCVAPVKRPLATVLSVVYKRFTGCAGGKASPQGLSKTTARRCGRRGTNVRSLGFFPARRRLRGSP